ncbi:hypothetical protein BGZ68_006527 [Mortierella alpina]|nr:hypothetical protein BGZ68_006527 [Mortierella alpina]
MATVAENSNGRANLDAAPGDAVPTTSVSNATTDENKEDSKKEVVLKQLYEQSTQYCFWRYTQAALDELRSRVNQEVISSIRANVNEERRLRTAQGLSVDHLPTDLQFLSVNEELALLGFYERKIVHIFRYWNLPSYVTGTAIVYMKRFFLENTIMDYHPKDVMLTCMFLARKTENFLMSIEDFVKVLKSDPEPILNLEFLVCKNLRFHFTVHHPYRPCLGFFYDMQATSDDMDKLQKVYESALKLIDTSLHTDLCFLYQPSQIALAAMRIAAKKESYDFEKYENYKFKANETAAQKYNELLHPVLLAIEQVLKEDPRCIEVEKAVLTEIDRRLRMCKDPAKDPESLAFRKKSPTESNADDDDDDDDEPDRPEKRAKLSDDSQ